MRQRYSIHATANHLKAEEPHYSLLSGVRKMKLTTHLRVFASFYVVLFFPSSVQLHFVVLTEKIRVLDALYFLFLSFFFLNACKNY